MIEMSEEEYAYSDFTDDSLRIISKLLGPAIKDQLLLPNPVKVKKSWYLFKRFLVSSVGYGHTVKN